MKEKYLPIGTVVNLKGATKKIMIIGYCPVENENHQMFDYSACLYPEGVIDSKKTLLFNHEQIEKIHFEGNNDDEFKALNEKKKKMIKELKNLKNMTIPEDKKEENQIETL